LKYRSLGIRNGTELRQTECEDLLRKNGRGERIWTSDPSVPNRPGSAEVSNDFRVSASRVASGSRSESANGLPWPAIDHISLGATMISAMNYQDRIVRDPQIVGGEPVLKGTRVTLKTVLASLAEGATAAEILADFPTLSEEDVRAAIGFAAASAQEDLPLAETPVKR
jgi:uncharacterized protein (DUF433 family)